MNFCYSCMRQLPDQKLNTCPYCGEMLSYSASVPDALSPGTTLQGKFVIGKLLGTGGFGNTYIGWNHVLSCRVAIKEFFLRRMSSRGADGKTISISDVTMKSRYEQSLRSFLEEARSLAELGSVPGIPNVYGYFEENGTGYIVMEYLEGITVKQLLKDSGGKLSYEWSRQIILSVLYTLKEIHRRGILHRDIAPDNIMITSEGIIQLIDFGVAKKQLSDAGDSVIMLKDGYSPPEQYSRDAVQGVYTDLYSVAATFYHMVTGEKPAGALKRVQQDTLQPLSYYGVKIPNSAEMAIMMCLYLEPKYRLGSAGEFMTALQGEDFKPIEELKQRVDSVDGKKAEKKNWEFPLVGKIASIALLTVVAVIGAILVLTSKHKSEDVRTVAVRAESVLGMSEEEAYERLSAEHLVFEVNQIVFDKSVNGSEILTQEPAAGEEVLDGKIVGTVRSSEKCTYGDILSCASNVYSLADALGIDASKVVASAEKDARDETMLFGDLYAVLMQDGTLLRQEDLKKEENAILKLSDIQSVTYYVSPYLYQKKLANYVGKNISHVSFSLCSEKNGKRIIMGKRTPPCDDIYYSFTKEEGYIVEQKIKKGKSYESFKYIDALFATVKEKIAYDSKNADGLIKKLKAKGFAVRVKGAGSEIASVTVSGKGGKGSKVCFTQDDTITVTRKAKAVPKPTKKPVAKPKGKTTPKPTKKPTAAPKSARKPQSFAKPADHMALG